MAFVYEYLDWGVSILTGGRTGIIMLLLRIVIIVTVFFLYHKYLRWCVSGAEEARAVQLLAEWDLHTPIADHTPSEKPGESTPPKEEKEVEMLSGIHEAELKAAVKSLTSMLTTGIQEAIVDMGTRPRPSVLAPIPVPVESFNAANWVRGLFRKPRSINKRSTRLLKHKKLVLDTALVMKEKFPKFPGEMVTTVDKRAAYLLAVRLIRAAKPDARDVDIAAVAKRAVYYCFLATPEDIEDVVFEASNAYQTRQQEYHAPRWSITSILDRFRVAEPEAP